MMMLTTTSTQTSPSTATVRWAAGNTKKGTINITLDFDSDEGADLIGELVAIKHLIFEKKVFGVIPTSGRGIKLFVSKGAIKKLVSGKSVKKYATKFAAFFNMRLLDIELEVLHSSPLLDDVDDYPIESLPAPRNVYAMTQEMVDTPRIGPVLISKHALDQYVDRNNDGQMKNPFDSLVKRLQHPQLRQLKIDSKVLEHKARKYGTADNIEIWGHESSTFKFQFLVNEDSRRVLLTVFEKA